MCARRKCSAVAFDPTTMQRSRNYLFGSAFRICHASIQLPHGALLSGITAYGAKTKLIALGAGAICHPCDL